MIYNTDGFIKNLETIGLTFDSFQVEKFIQYYELLIKWNDNINLTAIVDFDEVILKHFTDSLFLLKFYDIPKGAKVIDVGTGAGFPSVPIKIYRPDIKITLLDSLNKRIDYLKQLCDKLEIDAEFIHGRAEDFSKKEEYREKFDFSCARAVANMAIHAF